MLPATLRVLRRSSVAVVGHDGTRLNLLWTVGLLTVLLFAVPLAQACPGDPVWIAGIYDGADLDDSIDAVTSMTGIVEGFAPEAFNAVSLLLCIVPSRDVVFPAPAVLSPLSVRAPPTL